MNQLNAFSTKTRKLKNIKQNILSDEVLIKHCISDNRKYQEILYRKYADKMFNICLIYENDEDAAADILQEGFIKIFRNLKEFNYKGSFEGWLRKIIVNTALEHYRKKTKEKEKQQLIGVYIEREINDVLSALQAKDIIKMVNALPKKASIVLKLFAIEGYSHEEIAETLKIAVGTSKSQLNRARFLLKQSIS